MSIMRRAVAAVLRRNGWVIAFVVAFNVGLHFWRDGYASPADWFGTIFGVLLVSFVAVLIEAHKLSKTKRTSTQ